MHSLIAFDPGGTTGWCQFTQNCSTTMWQPTEFGQFPIEKIQRVYELIGLLDFVVFERIQVMHMGFDPIGLEVIGAIKLTCKIQGNKFVGQSPGILSGAKLWPELEEARRWFPRQLHARDAFYHGVTNISLRNMDLSMPPKCSP
jgi:hypothetical protein